MKNRALVASPISNALFRCSRGGSNGPRPVGGFGRVRAACCWARGGRKSGTKKSTGAVGRVKLDGKPHAVVAVISIVRNSYHLRFHPFVVGVVLRYGWDCRAAPVGRIAFNSWWNWWSSNLKRWIQSMGIRC